MTPVKICDFCSNLTSYVPLKVTLSSGDSLLRVHYCDACRAEYVYWPSAEKLPTTTHLYAAINDKTYRWSRYVHIKDWKFTLWYIGKPGIPGQKPNEDVKLLLKLENSPHITPWNIKEKIRFMLLFL